MAPKIIIFSAPSGAGKTTIIRYLMKMDYLHLEFSISATSRPPRNNEIHGKDYYFLSVSEFQNKINNGEFLEWEEVYDNQYYGTLKTEVDRIWERRKNILFDIDVQGGLNIKNIYKEKALAVFVSPPSLDELKTRIEKRSSESREWVNKRIAKAKYEMSFADQFDKVLLNDDLEKTLKESEKLVLDFIEKNNL